MEAHIIHAMSLPDNPPFAMLWLACACMPRGGPGFRIRHSDTVPARASTGCCNACGADIPCHGQAQVLTYCTYPATISPPAQLTDGQAEQLEQT